MGRNPHWARWVAELAAPHRVVTFDKPGTGLSDPIAEEPTVADFADDTVEVMNAVGSRRAVLLSMRDDAAFVQWLLDIRDFVPPRGVSSDWPSSP